jgi:hypothetical protein
LLRRVDLGVLLMVLAAFVEFDEAICEGYPFVMARDADAGSARRAEESVKSVGVGMGRGRRVGRFVYLCRHLGCGKASWGVVPGYVITLPVQQ